MTDLNLSRVKQKGVAPEHIAVLRDAPAGRFYAVRASGERITDDHRGRAAVFAELRRLNQSGMDPAITHYRRRGRNFKLPPPSNQKGYSV